MADPASPQARLSLDGRVVLITGGAGHLGRSLTMALTQVGASVAVLDSDSGTLRETVARITSGGGRAIPILADLSSDADVQAVPNQVVQHFGRLDVLVNCAALVGTSQLGGWAVPFEAQSLSTWRAALDVNLTAPFALAQVCAPELRRHGHGSIINISSIYGMVGPDLSLYDGTALGNPAAYAASKGGLLQLTRWLATVLAPRIRVNAVSLGGLWRGQDDAFRQRYEARTPLKRMGTEDDVIGSVVFLAGDLSAYITGQNMVVDGGWTAW